MSYLVGMSNALTILETLRNDFTSTSETGLEAACAVAAGEQNAAATLGWVAQNTEEFAKLAILSIECNLEGMSPEAREAFKKHGLSY